MPTHTKSLPGKLMDKENKELIAEGMIYLSLGIPVNPNRNPQFHGTMTVKGFTPQLYDKPYILHLDKFSGGVFIVTPPEIVRGSLMNRDLTQTPLKIMFEDSIWRSPEWVDFLRNLFVDF
jgi:hypothetical protein